VRLTIVGCSGSVSGPASPASCYLVQSDGFNLVLDLGPGSFGALHNHLDPATIGAVALSHLHPDHCLDLCALYVAARYSPQAPYPRIPVHGPPGTRDRIARAYVAPEAPGILPERIDLEQVFDFQDWRADQTVGPFTLSTTRVPHPTPAYAVRVTETSTGASLTYSGDNGPNDALVGLAADTDLLLVEAAFMDAPDNPPDVHLSGPQAARIGARAGAGTVVITHVPPWHDPRAVLAEARPHYSGPLETAVAGQVWTIRPTSEPTATLTR
jgi:ribonuclease BN (tRNA processing enzyme)